MFATIDIETTGLNRYTDKITYISDEVYTAFVEELHILA